jgi:hypothetical protein
MPPVIPMPLIEPTRWPRDMEAIRKGDAIPRLELEAFFGFPYEHRGYQLRLNALREWCENRLSRLGRPMVVACIKGELRFLTDVEAVAYTRDESARAWRRATRNQRRRQEIDATVLDGRTRHALDRDVMVHGAMLAGALAGRREALEAAAHPRALPGLPVG